MDELKEIKQILVGMQGKMDGMQGQMDSMQGQMDSMQGQMNNMQGQMNNMQQDIKRLENKQDETTKELKQEIREVNQRLAVFQEDVTPKINILFDADETRKELLEIHESEICNIKQEQFEHTLKINRLEQKVIGA